MRFIARTVVNIRNAPSLSAPILRETRAAEVIETTGEPVTAQNIIWHQLADAPQAAWVAERHVEGNFILLDRAPEVRPAPTPPTPPQEPDLQILRETDQLPQLPPNVDIDPADYERCIAAAFNITRAFEGGNFNSFNNHDAGIVSYGIFQFTLAGGALFTILSRFTDGSNSPTAQALRAEFLERVRGRDENLRHDMRFRQLLNEAAREPAMQEIQLRVGREGFWDRVIQNYVVRRGNMRYPLTYALLFDMGINFGVNHGFVRTVEERFGIPANSRVGTGGISEERLYMGVAELRRESHYNQAQRDNLPGLRARGDFWVRLGEAGDWFLQGDAEGCVETFKGRRVQVRRP